MRQAVRVIRSTPAFNTENIPSSFFAVCHPYFINTFENMSGFKKIEDYGSVSPFVNEIGALGRCRILYSDIITPWAAAGDD